MASDSVTLALGGKPTLDELATALNALRDLLAGLGSTKGEAKIEWEVSALQVSSAVTTFIGRSEDATAVDRVASEYLRLGSWLATGNAAELRKYEPKVLSSAEALVGVINGHVPSLRFETAEGEVDVLPSSDRRGATIAQVSQIPGAYGAVEGRIQTLTSRSTLRFTIYDFLHDRAVSCYLMPGQEDLVREMWDRVAVVKGWVRRDPLIGRPTAVRRIRTITPIDVSVEDSWRKARGAIPDTGPPAETVIRGLRDVE